MQIEKYDGSKKDWKLFRKRNGKPDWEWEEVGYYSLNRDGLIDASKFLADRDSNQIFLTFENFMNDRIDVIEGLLVDLDFDKAKDIISKCEEIEDEFDENKDIIVYDVVNAYAYTTERFVTCIDDDVTEYQVGVAIGEEE